MSKWFKVGTSIIGSVPIYQELPKKFKNNRKRARMSATDIQVVYNRLSGVGRYARKDKRRV